MKNKIKIDFELLGLILAAALFVFLGTKTSLDKNKAEEFKNELIAIAPANRPIISLSPETYNFGDVSRRKYPVCL